MEEGRAFLETKVKTAVWKKQDGNSKLWIIWLHTSPEITYALKEADGIKALVRHRSNGAVLVSGTVTDFDPANDQVFLKVDY